MKRTCPGPACPGVQCYRDPGGRGRQGIQWPQLDENTACALCYLRHHWQPQGRAVLARSTMLHAYATMMPDAMGLSSRDVVLPIVPMFHVNAWGTPYSCLMAGAKLVFPGGKMGDGATWRH